MIISTIIKAQTKDQNSHHGEYQRQEQSIL